MLKSSVKSSVNLRLQSVRGLAALTVAAFHSLILFTFPEKDDPLIRGIVNVIYGLGAVFVFFILSGYVLGLTLTKNKPYDRAACLAFLRHRFLRLFPTIAFSSCSYAIYYCFFYTPCDFPPVSHWFALAHPVSLGDLPANILLLKNNLNGGTWTLQVEALFSLLLPLLYFWTSRWPKSNFLALGLFLLLYYITPEAWQPKVEKFPWLFLFMCYSGWMLAVYRMNLSKWFTLLPRAIVYLIIAAAGAICTTTPHFGHHWDLFTAAASVLIGVTAWDITPRLWSFLDAKPLISMGNISYSFYIYHPLVLGICAQAILSSISIAIVAANIWLMAFLLFVISVCVAIPVSYLSFCLCERPFMSARRLRRDVIVVQPTNFLPSK